MYPTPCQQLVLYPHNAPSQLPSRRKLLAKLAAEKEATEKLKDDPFKVDLDAEARARLQALQGGQQSKKKAAPLPVKTAQVCGLWHWGVWHIACLSLCASLWVMWMLDPGHALCVWGGCTAEPSVSPSLLPSVCGIATAAQHNGHFP